MDRDQTLQLFFTAMIDRQEELEEYEPTPQKIWDRAVLVVDPERPDAVVFEVERHRAILAAIYQPGLPMAAFLTYWPPFAFHPAEKTFESLGEFRKPVASVDDARRLAEGMIENSGFSFEPLGDGRHLCRESCDQRECVVSDCDQVETFAEEIVQSWDFSGYQDELSDWLEPVEIEDITERLHNAACVLMRKKARVSWEEYLKEQDPGGLRET